MEQVVNARVADATSYAERVLNNNELLEVAFKSLGEKFNPEIAADFKKFLRSLLITTFLEGRISGIKRATQILNDKRNKGAFGE